MPEFKKHEFMRDADEAAIADIDKLMEQIGLEERFKDFPEVLEQYRRFMHAAWMAGTAWGFEVGIGDGYRRYYA